MPGESLHPPRAAPSLWRFLIALFAVASQIALAGAAMPSDAAERLASALVLCHADPSPDDDNAPTPHPAPRDCGLCPLCLNAAAAPAVLVSAPGIAGPAVVGAWLPPLSPAPFAVPVRRPTLAQARAPPRSV